MIEQESGRPKERGPSIKQMLILIVVLAVLSAVVWFINLFRLKNVTIDGLSRYTKEEFLEEIRYDFLSELTPVFCITDGFLKKEIPFIESYEIFYEDRQSASILVHEKRVTGCVIVMGRYWFFDKDGIIVETSAMPIEGIPIITGLEFDEIVLHQKLQVQKQSLFTTILQLTRLVEQNEIAVQEIAFDSGYEITLTLDGVIVMLGKKTSYDEEMNALAGILEALGERKGTLDMRNYSMENSDVIFKEQK